jgi:hypothetical protein
VQVGVRGWLQLGREKLTLEALPLGALHLPLLQQQWSSVAKGPKFRPQNSKGALQKFVRPEKLAAEFSPDLPKKGRKGAELS